MNILYVVKSLSVVEPLGIMQLSAVARVRGHKSFLGVLEDRDLVEKIHNHRIDLVALSFLSVEAQDFHKAATEIRRYYKDLAIIAGGPHPTFFPDIVDSWPINAVVIGEGDLVFGEIVDRIEKGEDIRDIKNVHTKNRKNELLPLVENLDEIPYADRELVHTSEIFRNVPMKSFMTSRGCPFSCAYCFNNAYKKLYVGRGPVRRQRSVENVIREIEVVLEKYPLNFVRFSDDVFVTKADEWLDEFVSQYKTRIGIPFYFLIYPHLVSREVICRLKDAGCHSAGISMETGNENLRKSIIKRPVSDEIIVRAYGILRDYDVKIISNCMLGLPESTIQDELESLELTFRCKPAYASFSVYTPFPGTDLYRLCKSKGYLNASFEDKEFPTSTLQKSCLSTFSDKEKDIHVNILMLGALANWKPGLRKLIVEHLIFWKPNKIFQCVGFFVRNYLQKQIWPVNVGLRSFMFLILKVYKIDKANYAKRRS